MAPCQHGAIAATGPLAAKPVPLDDFGDVPAHRRLGIAQGWGEIVRAQRLGTREIKHFDIGERFAREFLHRFARPLPGLDALFVEDEHEPSRLLRWQLFFDRSFELAVFSRRAWHARGEP